MHFLPSIAQVALHSHLNVTAAQALIDSSATLSRQPLLSVPHGHSVACNLPACLPPIWNRLRIVRLSLPVPCFIPHHRFLAIVRVCLREHRDDHRQWCEGGRLVVEGSLWSEGLSNTLYLFALMDTPASSSETAPLHRTTLLETR